MQDGMTWLLSSPEESLAYILADSGFDVWVANNRGTRWSSRHVSLDSSSRVRTPTTVEKDGYPDQLSCPN